MRLIIILLLLLSGCISNGIELNINSSSHSSASTQKNIPADWQFKSIQGTMLELPLPPTTQITGDPVGVGFTYYGSGITYEDVTNKQAEEFFSFGFLVHKATPETTSKDISNFHCQHHENLSEFDKIEYEKEFEDYRLTKIKLKCENRWRHILRPALQTNHIYDFDLSNQMQEWGYEHVDLIMQNIRINEEARLDLCRFRAC